MNKIKRGSIKLISLASTLLFPLLMSAAPSLNENKINDVPRNLNYHEDNFNADESILGDLLEGTAFSNLINPNEDRVNGEEIPSKYSSYTLGLSTPARNQNPYGTCWAFGATHASEASLIAKTGKVYDLSDLQLVYYFYHENMDPLGNARGDFNYNMDDTVLDEGGNTIFTMFGLSSWVNGALESSLPYTSTYLNKALNGTIDDSLAFSQDVAHCQSSNVISYSANDSSIKNVKREILRNGAVTVSYYHDSEYYNSKNGSYYTTKSSTNHCVSIVGWNDNYSKDLFGNGTGSSKFNLLDWLLGRKKDDGIKPSKNGAWLCKNSWGKWGTDGDAEPENSGSEGYFWISYYDESIIHNGKMFSFDFDTVDNYQYNYQYDGSYGSGTTSVANNKKIAAIYDIKGLTSDYEAVKAAGVPTYNADTTGTVYLYKNCEDNNPKTGDLVTSKSFSFQYPGVHTVDFDEEVKLAKGTNFCIVIDYDEATSVFVDKYVNNSWCKYDPSIENDRTYTLTDSSFTRETNFTYRIKAYTVDCEPDKPKETYTMSFNANGGENAPVNGTKTEGEDYELPLATPTKDGYTFLGWALSNNATVAAYQPGDLFTVDADTEFFAVWQKNLEQYAMTFNANGGNNAPQAGVKIEGRDYNLPTNVPTRDGYTFLGWALNNDATVATYQPGDPFTVDEDTEFFAIWSKNPEEYSMTFNANGGSNAPSALTKIEGEDFIIPASVPTREHYNFVGWALNKDATNAEFVAGNHYLVDEDTEFFAVWTPIVATSITSNVLSATLSKANPSVVATLTVTNSDALVDYELTYDNSNLSVTRNGNAFTITLIGELSEASDVVIKDKVSNISNTITIVEEKAPEIIVTVKASVTKTSTRVLFVKVNNYEAKIEASCVGSTIEKVQYSLTGLLYTTGTSFDSLISIDSFYIRVYDALGGVHNFYYDEGLVNPVTRR